MRSAHGRIHAAAQSAHHASVSNLVRDRADRLLNERCHRPIARAAADVEREIAEDLRATVGVRDFRMKQNGVQPPILVGHRGDRGIRAGRRHSESRGRALHEVAVARPDSQLRTDRSEDRRVLVDADQRVAIFPLRRRCDFSAERIRHELHPVADAQYGNAGVVHRRFAARRSCVGHTLRPARQHDADRLPRADVRDGSVVRQDFGVDRQLAQTARDQLRELRAEIQNDYGLMLHRPRVE